MRILSDHGEDPGPDADRDHLLQLFGMSGRVAVVTGASSGMGWRFAQVLSRAGACVVAAARRPQPLQELEDSLPRTVGVVCDVRDDADCHALIDHAISTFGRIDVLVNNAGVSKPQPVAEELPEDFENTLSVNLVGAYRLARLAGMRMVASRDGGSIINVASIVGLVGLGRMPQAGYAASKGALIALTRELAAQWARKGVRVNAIAPGFFPTEMTSGLLGSERGEQWVANLTPMGRSGQLHELDGALLYLAGQASSYVTGSVLSVDGGWTAV